MDWLEARCREAGARIGSLQIVYGIDGRHDLTEADARSLEGYSGSRPVRIGNGAYQQLQLDIYGELMDSVYLFNKYGDPISYDLWVQLRRMIDWVCDNWQREDEGIWEVRGGRRQFVYSKLMCWVALDRGLRLADKRSFPADRGRWLAERDAIYEDVMTRGWSERASSRSSSTTGARRLDASNLLMPLTFFLSPADRKMLDTLDAVGRPPKEGGLLSDGLVYRYDSEHSAGRAHRARGYLQLCTFWLVEALTRAGRSDPQEARGGATLVRAHARLRQPPRPVRRADEQRRRGARELSASAHAPGVDQRGLQPGPHAQRGALTCTSPRLRSFLSKREQTAMGKPFEGKVVLVTGASSGLGETAAVLLAEAGATVFGIARRKEALDAARTRHPEDPLARRRRHGRERRQGRGGRRRP